MKNIFAARLNTLWTRNNAWQLLHNYNNVFYIDLGIINSIVLSDSHDNNNRRRNSHCLNSSIDTSVSVRLE